MFLFVGSGQAQAVALKNEVISKFENTSKIDWVKYYKGRMDDLHDVALILASQGEECKGILIYLRSKVQFDIEGTLRNNKLELQEIDTLGDLTGYILGSLQKNTLLAEWSNEKHTINHQLKMEAVSNLVDIPTYCGDNKWIRTFGGSAGKEKIELVLYKYSYDKIKGTIYLKSKNRSYRLSGHVDQNDFRAEIYGADTKTIGSLKVRQIKDQKYSGQFSKLGIDGSFSLKMKEQMPVGCISFADYMTSYDITFPKTKNEILNTWIAATSEKFITECRNHKKALEVKYVQPVSELRANYAAYGWTDLSYVSDEFISGIMVLRNSWSSLQRDYTFNFDLKRNVMIDQNLAFTNEAQVRKILHQELRKKLKNHPLSSHGEFLNWVNNEDFDQFTIRPEGINFVSDFNSLYGKFEILIPWEQLNAYVSKDHALYKLSN